MFAPRTVTHAGRGVGVADAPLLAVPNLNPAWVQSTVESLLPFIALQNPSEAESLPKQSISGEKKGERAGFLRLAVVCGFGKATSNRGQTSDIPLHSGIPLVCTYYSKCLLATADMIYPLNPTDYR